MSDRKPQVQCTCGASFPTLVDYIRHAGRDRYTTHRKVLEGEELAEWRKMQARVERKKQAGGWI